VIPVSALSQPGCPVSRDHRPAVPCRRQWHRAPALPSQAGGASWQEPAGLALRAGGMAIPQL